MAKRPIYRALLYLSDAPPPDALLRAVARDKLVRVVSEPLSVTAAPPPSEAAGEVHDGVLALPSYGLSRPEKMRVALLGMMARGLLDVGDHVLGLVAREPSAFPDTLMVSQVSAGLAEEARVHGTGWRLGRPEVVEAVLTLALEVGAEGWEGHPVGALFVLGDAAHVMERSRQLGLNPFYGYSERERNLIDPAVRDAVHAFATLDGAIVVRDDGVVLAAGRYLDVHPKKLHLPPGLGARHVAAAAISAETGTTAFAVSQTSGVVRIFHGGHQVLRLSPARRLL